MAFGIERRVSSGRDELERVRAFFNGLGPSTPIGSDYLEDAVAVRFLSSRGALVAQYLIKRGPGSRYFSFIPEGQRPSTPKEEDICELTAFWMDRDLGRLGRMMVYLWMQVDLYRRAHRSWIVVGTERPRLRARNRLAFNRELWVGEDPSTGTTWFIDGIPHRDYLRRLFVGTPQMAVLQFLHRRRPGHELRSSPAVESGVHERV